MHIIAKKQELPGAKMPPERAEQLFLCRQVIWQLKRRQTHIITKWDDVKSYFPHSANVGNTRELR